jgi:hypothetical protein
MLFLQIAGGVGLAILAFRLLFIVGQIVDCVSSKTTTGFYLHHK